MFANETLLKMGDGHSEPLSALAQIIDSGLVPVATKPDLNSTAQAVGLRTSQEKFVELAAVGSTVPVIRCSANARLLLPGGGYAYAEECNGVPVATEAGTGFFVPVGRGTAELVSIRLATVHAACLNGIWFLTE